MSKTLEKKDILEVYRKKISTQDYSKKLNIEGIKIWELRNFTGEDGFLCEISRLTDKGKIEGVDDFHLRQINFSKVMPGGIKAWHLHLRQDDLWYVPPDGYLSVGLVDLREKSKSKEVKTKLVMGAGKSQLILIPAGVAHGCANFSPDPLYVFYFVNEQFDIGNPDEKRLPWDLFGEDFWKIKPG
jgi:dTDP-4-dehydrorhamnose 3,5-epimerase